MTKRVQLCVVDGRPLVGRKGSKYCSNPCRQKALRGRKSDSKRNTLRRGGVQIPPTENSDSEPVTDVKLILSDPRSANTAPDGHVLCRGCGEPTRQLPVILPTNEPGIAQVVPVYHSQCWK